MSFLVRVFYLLLVFVMTSLIFIGLIISSFLYLDLPFILSIPVLSVLVFSFALVFLISIWKLITQKIDYICFEKRISGKDLLLILFTSISYVYFVSQFFYHNFFQVISIYTDNVAHRLISKELLLNLSNSFALVHRNTTTGNIDFTDIFYPLGFHSLIYFIAELFSVSVDVVIYYLFLFVWTILIPLTIFYTALFLSNSFRIAFIFTIIFLSTSEILLQYYYLGLWPFLIGFTAGLFILSLGLSLNGKRLLLLFPLILGILSIYSSFAIITLFLLFFFKLPSGLKFKMIWQFMSFRNIIVFALVFFLSLLFIFISNIYINILIILNSVLNLATSYNIVKLIDLELYQKTILARFFDTNLSRSIILLFGVLATFMFIFNKIFRNILSTRFLILYILICFFLLISLTSGVIGPLNFLINPVGLLFYYDFNRIYILYLLATVLIVSYFFYYVIFMAHTRSIIFIFLGSMFFVQISSTFTERLPSNEITLLADFKINSELIFPITDFQSLVHCDRQREDPTKICFTYQGKIPDNFTNENYYISRDNSIYSFFQ